eukprot:9236734-Pyramimonas_sp.AAC.1
MPALFSIHNGKNEITCMFGTHVDDMLWAADDGSQRITHSLLAGLDIREIKWDISVIVVKLFKRKIS